jgi:MipA family protein
VTNIQLSAVSVKAAAYSSALLAAVVYASPALAQEMGPPPDAPMDKPFDLAVGGVLANQPAYLGSDERKTAALPLVIARWRNGWSAGTTGVGFRFSSDDSPLSGGLRLGFDLGRKESVSAALAGMGDTKARAVIGTFASYLVNPGLSIGSSINYGSGNDKNGLLMDISLRSMIPLGGAHRLFGNVGLTLANQAAMQSQFGVTAAQSASSGYAVYTPGSGLRDLNLGVGYGYAFSPSTLLQLGLSLRALQGDAKDSPLTRSYNGTSVNMGLIYRM